jgi:hypothetical protein
MPMRLRDVLRRDAHDPRPAPCRPNEVQQQPDGRRLPGAIRSEEPEHLAALDRQVQTVEGQHVTKALGKTLGTDRGREQVGGHRSSWTYFVNRRQASGPSDTGFRPVTKRRPRTWSRH